MRKTGYSERWKNLDDIRDGFRHVFSTTRINTNWITSKGHIIVYEYEIHYKLFGHTLFKTYHDNYYDA